MINERKRTEFIEKLVEAKRLEKEAFLSLLPESARGHLNVIEKEVRLMLSECMKKEPEKKPDNIKKVTIE